MSNKPFQLMMLNAAHERITFNSGSEPLDRYLQEQVTQDIRRRITACFVALADEKRIAGYYTLAPEESLCLQRQIVQTGKEWGATAG